MVSDVTLILAASVHSPMCRSSSDGNIVAASGKSSHTTESPKGADAGAVDARRLHDVPERQHLQLDRSGRQLEGPCAGVRVR